MLFSSSSELISSCLRRSPSSVDATASSLSNSIPRLILIPYQALGPTLASVLLTRCRTTTVEFGCSIAISRLFLFFLLIFQSCHPFTQEFKHVFLSLWVYLYMYDRTILIPHSRRRPTCSIFGIVIPLWLLFD